MNTNVHKNKDLQENKKMLEPFSNIKNKSTVQFPNYEKTSEKNIFFFFKTDYLNSKLKNLCLSFHNLIEVPPEVTNFKYLRELNLSNNFLESWPKETNLYNLLVLNLSHNNLSSLPSTLKHCYQLSCLNISHNNFLEVPDVLLYGLRAIKVLDLSFNKISEFKIPPGCLINVTELYCSNNMLETFPNWIFSVLCKLEKIDLEENFIRFPSKPLLYFNSGVFESLQYLNITNCNFAFDGYEFLSYFKNIRFLNIGNKIHGNINRVGKNYLGNFKMDSLNNFSKLEILNIKNTQLSIIPEGFEGLKNLKFLEASHNMLSWLPESFCNLTSLSVLDLSSNQLLFLPSDIYKLKNLLQLHLSNNKLYQLPKTLSQLPNLEYLDAYNNIIENIDVNIFNMEKLQGVDFGMNCINFNKISSGKSTIAIETQYDWLKNVFREKFKYVDSRVDIQVKHMSNDVEDNVCQDSGIYCSKSYSFSEDDASSDVEDESTLCESNYTTVENQELDDDWGGASTTMINEDELFDPNKMNMYALKPNKTLCNSVFYYNYCPANVHLQPVVSVRSYFKIRSIHENIEEGKMWCGSRWY